MSMNKIGSFPNDKPFHSSIYAEASRKNQIGSMSLQPFSQRTEVENNRRAIRQYRESMVARGRMHHSRRTPIDIVKSHNETESSTRQIPGTRLGSAGPIVPPRAAFKEPSRPRYNPYS